MARARLHRAPPSLPTWFRLSSREARACSYRATTPLQPLPWLNRRRRALATIATITPVAALAAADIAEQRGPGWSALAVIKHPSSHCRCLTRLSRRAARARSHRAPPLQLFRQLLFCWAARALHVPTILSPPRQASPAPVEQLGAARQLSLSDTASSNAAATSQRGAALSPSVSTPVNAAPAPERQSGG